MGEKSSATEPPPSDMRSAGQRLRPVSGAQGFQVGGARGSPDPPPCHVVSFWQSPQVERQVPPSESDPLEPSSYMTGTVCLSLALRCSKNDPSRFQRDSGPAIWDGETVSAEQGSWALNTEGQNPEAVPRLRRPCAHSRGRTCLAVPLTHPAGRQRFRPSRTL